MFNWIFSVDDRDLDAWTRAKITFQVSYQRRVEPPPSFLLRSANATSGNDTEEEEEDDAGSTLSSFRETRLDHYKLRARIDVNKDDVQKVVPIAKVSIKLCRKFLLPM